MAKRVRSESLLAEIPASGAEASTHTPKYIELDTLETNDQSTAIHCSLPPHEPVTFATYPEYEAHYSQSHTNRCRDCHKNFPSNHLLELHLAENHDPIVAARRDRGEKTYACFVKGCDKVCLEWKKRRSHLKDKHGFPPNYDFFIVNNGVDGRRSMLRPGVDAQGHRKSSRERGSVSVTEASHTPEATSLGPLPESTVSGETIGQDETTPMPPSANAMSSTSADSISLVDDITKSLSTLQFVPRSITFGKRKGKAGFAKS